MSDEKPENEKPDTGNARRRGPDATDASEPLDDAALDALYRAGEPELPPSSVDCAIFAAAASAGHGRRRRWIWPAATGLSSAAAVLLAVALIIQTDGVHRPGAAPSVAPPAPAFAARRLNDEVASDASPAPATTDAMEAPQGALAERPAAASARENAARRLELHRSAAGDEPQPRTAAGASPAPVADTVALTEAAGPQPAGVRYRHPGCPQDLSVPDGAVLQTVDGGAEVTLPEGVFRMTCVEGAWVRTRIDPQD